MFRFNFSDVITNLYLRCTLAGLSIDESSPELFVLNIDCLEEIFEWLSLSDLLTLRQTCKQLRHVVNYYIKANYPTIEMGFKKIAIFPTDFETFHNLDSVTTRAIRQVHFWTEDLNSYQIDVVRDILPQIERLLIGWPADGEFYENFLQFCPNVKYMSMLKGPNRTEDGRENLWLLQQYPLLEHFLVNDFDSGGPEEGWEVPLLRTFFQQNPNIRIFSTTFNFLRRNTDCWLGANIKLDQLEITGFASNIKRTSDLLNTLYDQGFYKHIHVYVMFLTTDTLRDLSELKGLEKLYLKNNKESIVLPPLNELKELAMNCVQDPEQLTRIAQNLTSIERIFVAQATINDVLPFIQHAQNVNKIKINRLEHGNRSENITLDLITLNKYRKELVGASKITIYVPEKWYLETKWTMGTTDYSLIELKRAETYIWDHLFF
ncbi:uncharacterized protein LOC129570589 [Sitodiplosis mosellana]|uniref:uncharacterized protein LOC129570589 n=1 Tax=Sitodiplosis mosellana TaxID=263140 RepID=UPI002444EEBE|nr:uncharacterized protein LOC129570589 [Sitodiplosis mosellana]